MNVGGIRSTYRDVQKSLAAKWVDYSILLCLFLFAVFAPHSIAATQTIWLLGMVLWVARFAFYPPPNLYRTPLDYVLLGFFILTGLSAFLSYEPLVSIGKLRAASLFTIVYLFAQNIPSRRVVRLLAVTLIASCMINVLFTVGERIVGRGIKVHALSMESPLYQSGVRAGDTLLEIDGRKLNHPQDLITVLSMPEARPTIIKTYRYEFFPTFKVERGRFLAGIDELQQLGIERWSRGRDWRAAGFYGHYTTYAEALQLIMALVVGMIVSLPNKRGWAGVFLSISLSGLTYALIMTVTRASWLAVVISTAIILVLSVRRRTIILIGALSIPLILAGLLVLQQKRNVAFVDSKDGSITWRGTVWREGFNLLVSNPRHLLVGIGMDSIKAHWREWGMFDQGRLPRGHMHSNVLQIALERGVPALIVWLILLSLYGYLLFQLHRRLKTGRASSKDLGGTSILNLGPWIERGFVLGAFGGLVGFFVSGLVHYNWGDSEVAMIFYFIMGLILVIERHHSPTGGHD